MNDKLDVTTRTFREEKMKTIALEKRAIAAEEGEAVLGLSDTGSHACYMIYGIVRPGEKKRLVKPGKGHEEIILAAKGGFDLTGEARGRLEEGCAFYCAGEISIFLENSGAEDAVYVIAGGHSEEGHHH
ncbi:MAG: hypothetical protein R6T92_00945 [Desulfosalsimonadaceae bacterium]